MWPVGGFVPGVLVGREAAPANPMVMEPGGCRFTDYWEPGIVVMGRYFVVAVFLVPLIWPV